MAVAGLVAVVDGEVPSLPLADVAAIPGFAVAADVLQGAGVPLAELVGEVEAGGVEAAGIKVSGCKRDGFSAPDDDVEVVYAVGDGWVAGGDVKGEVVADEPVFGEAGVVRSG